MHELSLATELIAIAEEHARRANAVQIESLTVRIGPLAGVVTDALLFAFDVVAAKSMAADAELCIESVPVTAFCPLCNSVKRLTDPIPLVCPHCATPTPDVRSGREFELSSMRIRLPESEATP